MNEVRYTIELVFYAVGIIGSITGLFLDIAERIAVTGNEKPRKRNGKIILCFSVAIILLAFVVHKLGIEPEGPPTLQKLLTEDLSGVYVGFVTNELNQKQTSSFRIKYDGVDDNKVTVEFFKNRYSILQGILDRDEHTIELAGFGTGQIIQQGANITIKNQPDSQNIWEFTKVHSSY